MYNVKITGLALILLSLAKMLIDVAYAESKPEIWTPEPKFRIENRSYIETLIFISGVSYAMTSSNSELNRSGKKNFFCLKDVDTVGSKILIDIINEKYTGNITSEQAIGAIAQGLKKRYPCQ